MERDQYAGQDSAPGRDMTEREIFEREVQKAKADAEAKVPYPVATTNDRRIERIIERLRHQSQAATDLFYTANQLQALLDCLPRQMPLAATEGLRYLLNKAGL